MSSNKKETYISIDIETNGPVPGIYSMLSLGAVAYDDQGNKLDTFYVNITELEDAKTDPDTMRWWSTEPEAWKALQVNKRDPATAMKLFEDFCLKFSRPVAICYPSGFDWTFVYWYLHRFNGKSVLGFSCVDIKTYGMAILDTNFRDSKKSEYYDDWFDPNLKHTHNAIDDALEQGYLFFKMKEYNKRLQ